MKNKVLLCLFFLLLFQTLVFSQDNLVEEGCKGKDLLFASSHHTLFFSSFLSKGNVNREKGEADLVNKLGIGFTGGWLYTHHFSPKWSIETGFAIGVLPFKYEFNLEADKFGLPFDFDDYYT